MPDRILNGRYRLGRLLGRGGMAEVYEARDELLDRPVAVKMLRPDMAADREIRGRFEVEARSAARLHHPNVVSVFDTGEDEGEPYLVMERLPGESLADRMAGGPVDPDWLRAVAGDVLAALGAAHDVGLVHRDVKPANVLLTAEGQAKVADFGIAKSAEAVRGGDPTSTGLLLGTPAYLAPERIHGEQATARSDLYSLGVVLYEALTGVKPFVGDTALAVATAIVTSPAPSLEPAGAGARLDPQMIAAVERAMAKNPAQRPATAAEMAADLGLGVAALTAMGSDATVAMAGGRLAGGADPTLVSAPGTPDRAVPVEQDQPHRRPQVQINSPLAHRRRLAPALLAAAAVLLFIVLIAAAGGGGGGGAGSADRTALASELSDLADRMEVGDGAKGPEAAKRLREVADQVEAGGGGDSATDLLGEATDWNREGQLFRTAYNELVSLLRRVPGVDASVLNTTTVAPPTTSPAPPPDEEDREEDRRGNKKRGKDD
ncbi:MAG TPA: serine/threonine-protein kinase [Acidimicrobiales bacterium]|nr:serine/threonine-protein kinase [Acidimicrobiales bacterium]